MLIGSHVGMKGKEMFLGSVKEALSYGANTFMVYTGAPQNTRRKKIEELRVEEGRELKIGPYEFDVLFFLLEHMGRAVSREEINKILPQRKREGGRNVDTHIKNLRRRLDLNDVILSVRSVGYRIDEERFYQKMTEKQE